jgi:hypothetical protein
VHANNMILMSSNVVEGLKVLIKGSSTWRSALLQIEDTPSL